MKNSNSQTATKGDILLVKDNIKLVKDDIQLVKKDIKSVEKSLRTDITRLDKKIDGVEKSLRSEIRINSKELEEKLDEKAQKYRDQILTKMDNILDEITDSREERAVVSHQIADHSDRIEILEKDVSRLKSTITPQ